MGLREGFCAVRVRGLGALRVQGNNGSAITSSSTSTRTPVVNGRLRGCVGGQKTQELASDPEVMVSTLLVRNASAAVLHTDCSV